MKRSLIVAALAILMSVPTFAQGYKIDQAGVQRRIDKSDTDIRNEKKNNKPAVWLERGKVFVEAATQPFGALYAGMPLSELERLYGAPQGNKTRDLGGGDVFEVYEYPYFDAYYDEGMLLFWDEKQQLYPDALAEAVRAYDKAYEVDNRSASRVRTGLEEVANYYKQAAGNRFNLGNYEQSALNFRKAYDVGRHPAYNIVDTATVYNAGFLYTISLDFQDGLDALQEAEKYGYASDGDLYYYLFHCYYGLGRTDEAMSILLKGLGEYPENNKIVEGLVGLYAETNQDPRDILPIVEHAIENDPRNPGLWSGLGRIYENLGEPDKALQSMESALALAPNDFNYNFNLGLQYVKRGDEINTEMSQTNYTSQADFEKDLDRVLDNYDKAMAPLEKAHELYPNEPITIELLKNVTFRLRERPGMAEKYAHYNDLFESIR